MLKAKAQQTHSIRELGEYSGGWRMLIWSPHAIKGRLGSGSVENLGPPSSCVGPGVGNVGISWHFVLE